LAQAKIGAIYKAIKNRHRRIKKVIIRNRGARQKTSVSKRSTNKQMVHRAKSRPRPAAHGWFGASLAVHSLRSGGVTSAIQPRHHLSTLPGPERQKNEDAREEYELIVLDFLFKQPYI